MVSERTSEHVTRGALACAAAGAACLYALVESLPSGRDPVSVLSYDMILVGFAMLVIGALALGLTGVSTFSRACRSFREREARFFERLLSGGAGSRSAE